MGPLVLQVLILLLLARLGEATQPPEDDMDCKNVMTPINLSGSVESVEYANSKQLSSILEELLNTTYFR